MVQIHKEFTGRQVEELIERCLKDENRTKVSVYGETTFSISEGYFLSSSGTKC